MQPKTSQSQLPVRSWLLTSRSSVRVLAQAATTGHPSRPPLSLGILWWVPLPDAELYPCETLQPLLCCVSHLPAFAVWPGKRTGWVIPPDFLPSLKIRETQQSLLISPQAQPSPSSGAPCPQKRAQMRCGSWGHRRDALPSPSRLRLATPWPSARLAVGFLVHAAPPAWNDSAWLAHLGSRWLKQHCPRVRPVTYLSTFQLRQWPPYLRPRSSAWSLSTAFRTRQCYLFRCLSFSWYREPRKGGDSYCSCHPSTTHGAPRMRQALRGHGMEWRRLPISAENCRPSQRLLSTDADSSCVISLIFLLSFESRCARVGSALLASNRH